MQELFLYHPYIKLKIAVNANDNGFNSYILAYTTIRISKCKIYLFI
jgi:hypothetical protein